MIGAVSPGRIFLYRGAADMRKGFDGLAGIVRGELEADPMDGTLFVFLNRSRDMVKALYWDQLKAAPDAYRSEVLDARREAAQARRETREAKEALEALKASIAS